METVIITVSINEIEVGEMSFKDRHALFPVVSWLKRQEKQTQTITDKRNFYTQGHIVGGKSLLA